MRKCECGCGGTTAIATATASRRGVRKGQPMRFMPGHNNHGAKLATPSQRKAWILGLREMGVVTSATSKSEIWDLMVDARIVSPATQFEDIGFSRLMAM